MNLEWIEDTTEAPDDIKTLAMLGAKYQQILDYHRADKRPRATYLCPRCSGKVDDQELFCTACVDRGVIYL